MRAEQERIRKLMDEYEQAVPAWVVALNKEIITCSINQSSCINEQHRGEGLRLSAINILYNIGRKGGVSTQKELTESMSISKQALTLAVNSLESHGLVERYADQKDRRIRYIRLTKEGLDQMISAQEARSDFLNSITEVLSEEEALRTIETLKRLNHFYKEYLEQF